MSATQSLISWMLLNFNAEHYDYVLGRHTRFIERMMGLAEDANQIRIIDDILEVNWAAVYKEAEKKSKELDDASS